MKKNKISSYLIIRTSPAGRWRGGYGQTGAYYPLERLRRPRKRGGSQGFAVKFLPPEMGGKIVMRISGHRFAEFSPAPRPASAVAEIAESYECRRKSGDILMLALHRDGLRIVLLCIPAGYSPASERLLNQ